MILICFRSVTDSPTHTCTTDNWGKGLLLEAV